MCGCFIPNDALVNSSFLSLSLYTYFKMLVSSELHSKGIDVSTEKELRIQMMQKQNQHNVFSISSCVILCASL